MSLTHLDRELSAKRLLKRGQMLLHAPDFDLAVMGCVDIQRHVLRIYNTQTCVLNEASMATVQIFSQTEQPTQGMHHLLGSLIQSSEFGIFFARQSLTMIQGRCCHNGN